MLFISFNYVKINNMKKNAYNILIILFCATFFVLALFGVFFFKKDFGKDENKMISYPPLKTFSKPPKAPETKTINGIDYLKSNLPIGKFKGEYVSYILGEPATFNPYNASDATSAELSEIMYDGLVMTNPDNGKVIPKLAKSFEVLKDKKTYIIHLRHGLTWSDGKEITSKDVFFTYHDVIFKGLGEGATKDVMTIDGKLPSVKIIDKYTVEFKTPKPFAPFLRNLSASILPEHIFKIPASKGNASFLTFQGVDVDPSKIVYSGPFKLKSYTPSQRVIFERNPNYYMINSLGQKLPYLDRWVMLIVADTNNATIKFESGAIDTITIQPNLLNRYRELKKEGDFELYNLGPTTNTTFITFNLNNRKNKNGKYYVSPIKQKWFQDRNFRTAIDWAIDRDDLILNVFSGLSSPLYTAEAINSLYINENLAKGHKKDLKKAFSYLSKSGFYLKDGKLYDKNKNRVEFELLTNAGNTQREATGVSIKQDLEQLGIKVNFKPVEFNSLVTRLINSPDYDCIIIALTSNLLEPNSGYNVWAPYGSSHLFNKRTKDDLKGTDTLLPFEKELWDIFNKASQEFEISKRKELYNKYQEIIAKENPMVYLYAPINIVAVRNKLKNLYPTKINGLIYSISDLYVEN